MAKLCVSTDFIFPKSSTVSENNNCINYQKKKIIIIIEPNIIETGCSVGNRPVSFAPRL